jgi:uncharacterized radical SAM superfamily protein
MEVDFFKEAWQVRRKHFGDEIWFFAPGLKYYETSELRNDPSPTFVPVSVTGERCSLQCKHCGGQILKSMLVCGSPAELRSLGETLFQRGCRGILLSGGSSGDGRVPLEPFLPAALELKRRFGFRIAVHAGFVDRALAVRFKEAQIDSVMIDIIGSDDTIREVCGLHDATTADFDRSLEALALASVPISPHVVIGLHWGKILGERRALEIISGYREALRSVVLVVLSPLSGTAMEKTAPPAPEEVAEVLVAARLFFPETRLLFGCAKPIGKDFERLDRYALLAGVNGIAYPAEGMVKEAAALGLAPKFSQLCCSLID